MVQRPVEPKKRARLRFHTARVTYAGPGRFMVTAGKGDSGSEPFAPTWKLVRWAKNLLAQATTEEQRDWAFQIYAERYLVQMRQSYRDHRAAWDELLSREEAVLCCYCNHPRHCHRYLLAEYLGKLGATYLGDLG